MRPEVTPPLPRGGTDLTPLRRPGFDQVLQFLGEDCGLAPADGFFAGKAILVDDSEVFLGLVFHFLWRMTLKAEEYFEQHTNSTRMNREVQQVPTRRDHTCEFSQPISKLHVFQRA